MLSLLLDLHAGLASAIALLEPVKEEYPSISYADLFQLGSAVAIEVRFACAAPLRQEFLRLLLET